MSSKKTGISCKIFVGFGGSGGKTLHALAKMFAADKEWAKRCETEAYFLIADTDADDLGKNEERIRSTLARVGAHAYVDKVLLSEGVARMDRLITEQLATAIKSKQGLARVKEAWWFNEKEEPFIARNVQLPPSEGASQCPAISHFLAWNSVGGVESKIGRVINRLYNEMATRVTLNYGASTEYEVKMFLVAGLAGGTGRGSWATFSYKVADIFDKKGKPVSPIGVFFDQSCFSNVAEGAQGQRVKMLVNSLTGISEITGWIENDSDRNKNRRYKFRLPSFSSPSNQDADLINVENLIQHDSQAGATPVRQAYFIFRDNPAGNLGADQHYKIAAAALYGRTANSEIDSQLSNTRQYVGSLGASMYRVDVDGIRRFMAKRLEYDAAMRFVRPEAVVRPDAIADRILLPLTASSADRKLNGSSSNSVNKPQFLARLNAAILHGKKNRIANLIEEIEGLSREERDDAIKAIANFDKSNAAFKDEVARAVRQSIRHVFSEKMDPPEGTPHLEIITHYIRNALLSPMPDPEAVGVTLNDHRTSIAVAKALIASLRAKLPALPARIAPEQSEATVEWACNEIEKKSGRTLLVAGKRFSDAEKGAISEILEKMVLEQGQAALKPMFEKWCEQVLKLLGTWSDNLDLAIGRASSHADGLAKEVGSDAHDELFTTDKDFEKAKKPPQDRAGVGRDPERQLEPLGLEKNVRKWMDALSRQKDERLELALEKIRTTILHFSYSTAGSGHHDEDLNKKFKRDLSEMFKSLASNVNVNPEFIRDNFRLAQVAEELVHEWGRRIDEARNDPTAQHHMETKFLEFFGFKMAKSDGLCVVPDRKEIIEKMALRLGENCRAQYLCRATSGVSVPKVHTLVFLPTDRYLVDSDGATKEWKKELKRMADSLQAPISFHVEQEGDQDGEDCRGNAFMMLAVVTEGFPRREDLPGRDLEVSAPIDFDLVSSMDYWRAQNDPHLKTFMEWVEDPHGKSMFADVSYSFGLGYIMPAFVNNKALREARWRPWAKAIESEVERKGHLSIDAILYGLLGTKDGKSPLFALSVKEDNGTQHKWTLPLLKFGPAGSTKNAFTFTRQAFTNESGGWRPKARAFEEGHHESSVRKLVDLLSTNVEITTAIMKEANHFFGTLCFTEGFIDQNVKQLFLSLSDWIHEHLRSELERLPNFLEYKELLEQLEERAMQLSKLGREELCEIYKA